MFDDLGRHEPERSWRTLWLWRTCRRCHHYWVRDPRRQGPGWCSAASQHLIIPLPSSQAASRVQRCRGVDDAPTMILPAQPGPQAAPPLPVPIGFHVNPGRGRHRIEGPPPGYREKRFPGAR